MTSKGKYGKKKRNEKADLKLFEDIIGDVVV